MIDRLVKNSLEGVGRLDLHFCEKGVMSDIFYEVVVLGYDAV
jgi:hypothetical protein